MGLIVDSLLDGHRYKAIFSQVDTPYYEPFSGSPIIETKLQSGKSNFIFDLTNDPYEANNLLDNEHDAVGKDEERVGSDPPPAAELCCWVESQ